MKGLIILLGESFRQGNQGTRIRGTKESYEDQIKACNSHILLIKHLENIYKTKISVYVSTYKTQYTDELLKIYNEYIIGNIIYDNVIGINNLFNNSISNIQNIESYNFIFVNRIDLFFKDYFLEVFNPNWTTIRFPTICFIPHHKCGTHPRVNDMMLFIPKKYYKYIHNIHICHESWYNIIKNTDLKYDDMDTMLNTYHDSDSFKDLNPIYRIVNRIECNKTHTQGVIFDKFNFK